MKLGTCGACGAAIRSLQPPHLVAPSHCAGCGARITRLEVENSRATIPDMADVIEGNRETKMAQLARGEAVKLSRAWGGGEATVLAWFCDMSGEGFYVVEIPHVGKTILPARVLEEA